MLAVGITTIRRPMARRQARRSDRGSARESAPPPQITSAPPPETGLDTCFGDDAVARIVRSTPSIATSPSPARITP